MDPDYLAATDPTTTPQELWRIANTRPDLHQTVLAHPNIYPDLANWIVSQGATPPTVVPPATSATVKKRKTGLIIGLIAGALVLVVGGFLGWWFFLRDGESVSYSEAYDAPPQVRSVVDVSTFGRNVEVLSMGPTSAAALDAGDLTLVGLRSGGVRAVAGIRSAGSFALPNWIVPTHASLDECVVGNSLLDCGADTYRVKATAAFPVADTTADGKPESVRPQSVPVGSTASETLGYAIVNGSLVTADGTAVVLVPDNSSPYYAIPSENKGIPTLVSDGRSLIAVDGGDVTWSAMLPAGSSEVNGFADSSEPSWRLEGQVLLVGEPEGIVALDVRTGEELWQVQTPVVSWRADQELLVVSQGDAVALLHFGGSHQETPGTELSDPAPKVLQVGGPHDSPTPTPFEQLLDASLTLPSSCGLESGLGGSPVAFEGGGVTGPEGAAQMTHLSRVLVSGELATVISFECASASGIPVSTVGAYDADLGILGELDFTGELAFEPWQVWVEGLRGEGSAIQIVAETDEGKLCPECSFEAQVQMLWDGDQFVTVEVTQPPANWWELGGSFTVEGIPAWEAEVLPTLEPSDLADVELSLPVFPGSPDSPYVSRTFSGYVAEFLDDGVLIETGIDPGEIVSSEIGGETFLFASIWSYADQSGTLIGSVCAISGDLAVTCAPIPDIGTGFIAAADVSVSGDQVSYNLYGSAEAPLAQITQSFDGEQFTLLSDVR